MLQASSPSFEKSMRCAKSPTLPRCRSTNAAAAALLCSLGWEVFVVLGQSCLCSRSVDTAPASAGECPLLGVPTELARSCWVLSLGALGVVV